MQFHIPIIMPGNTNQHDLYCDLQADFILANPPFNLKDLWGEQLTGNKQWQYGQVPKNNRNCREQHITHHLVPSLTVGFVQDNSSTSSKQSGEREIRRNLIWTNPVNYTVKPLDSFSTPRRIQDASCFSTATAMVGYCATDTVGYHSSMHGYSAV